MANLGLDVGTGYCKAYTSSGRVMFPSLVIMREHNIWNRIKRRPMTLVGEEAEEALNERGRIIRPVSEGRILHEEAYNLLVKDALERLRLKPEETRAVAGTLSRVTEEELNKLESLLKNSVGLAEVQIYPASLGTLISMGLESGIILDIGEGATNLLAVEDREIVDFSTTIVAVDAVLNALKTRLATEYTIDLRTEEVRLLAISMKDKLKKYTVSGVKELTADEVGDMIKRESSYFAEELADLLRVFLRKASTGMLDNIVITGGGTYFFEEPLKSLLPEVSFKKPMDPSFANAEGLYRVAEAIFQETPQRIQPTPEITIEPPSETPKIPERVTITPSDESYEGSYEDRAI
ncbi:MAG: rod shape-determining protein [Candidatus Bathyarchaeia archaeon]